jgi:hypothetical protein
MDISGGLALEDFDGKVLLRGVPGSHPEQQTTMIELLLDMLRALVPQPSGQPCSRQPTSPAAQRRCPGNGGKRPARSSNGPHEQTGSNVHECADDSPLAIADRLG